VYPKAGPDAVVKTIPARNQTLVIQPVAWSLYLLGYPGSSHSGDNWQFPPCISYK